MKQQEPTKTPIQELEQKHHDKIVGVIAEKIEAERRPAPHGWKLVPVEPTEDMTAAGFEALMAWDARTGEDMGIEDTYSAMLAAAPTPPAQTEPSDEEIISLAYDCNALPEVITDESLKLFSRALLSRYGQAPAASAEPVAWVAADTLNSPHPTCVSSLAYMSQLDKDRGREYVPLYAAPVAAQTADDARDAERWREVERRARKHTAYDRYGDGAHWSVSVFSDDSRQTFGETIDAAIQADRASRAALAANAAPMGPQHIDDEAVDRFAAALKEKLAQARAKGRSGWHECDPADLSRMLREHVEKGDPRDVANFCMFLWSLGQPISAAPAAPLYAAHVAAQAPAADAQQEMVNRMLDASRASLDTAMLDWIEDAWFYRDGRGELTFAFNECWSAGNYPSLRAAIQAAMQRESGGGV